MSAATPILGQYEATQAASEIKNKNMTDKDTFLKLLITQLTHQDPLNPTEDKEFIAQLAQFTTVEELQNMNQTVSAVGDRIKQSQLTNAAALIGTTVYAAGDYISFQRNGSVDEKGNPVDYSTTLYSSLPGAASSVTYNIWSTDANGNPGKLVDTVSVGARPAGEIGFTWDGLDSNGNYVGDGTFVVTVQALDAGGNQMMVTNKSAGIIYSVEVQDDGNHKLYLYDGRSTFYNSIERLTITTGGGSGNSGNTGGNDNNNDSNNSDDDSSADNSTDDDSVGDITDTITDALTDAIADSTP